MPSALTDPSYYEIPDAQASASQVIIPQRSVQATTLNLAGGAQIDFEFNIDVSPIFDMFVRSDQVLIVRVFVRASTSDSYAQLGNDYNIAALHPSAAQPLTGIRLPGSQVRIRLRNDGVAATANLSAQIHARSI